MTLIRLWLMAALVCLAIVGCSQAITPDALPGASPTVPSPFATPSMVIPATEEGGIVTVTEVVVSASVSPLSTTLAPTLAPTLTVTPVPTEEETVTVSEDIDWIACVGSDRNIWLVNPINSEQKQLTNSGTTSYQGGPAWSPDGSKLVIGVGDLLDSTLGPVDLATIDLTTGKLEPLGLYEQSNLMAIGWPAWSADNSTIYYSITDDGLRRTWKLRQVRSDGKGQEEIPPISKDYWWESYPAFSPDGHYLTYGLQIKNGVGLPGSQYKGNWGIWLFDIDNQTSSLIIEDVLGKSTWSPDSSQIAYASDSGSGGIFIYSVDSGNIRHLTDIGQYPTWSPDGKQIAFEVKNGPNQEIWVVNIDATNPRKIANGSQPAWRPQQRH
jgi:Tol biopolymer transport system component